jgi:hypothetical protein
MQLSKTNYLIYRDCPHSAWVKVHEPEVYNAKPLSLFDQSLLETGRDVDELAAICFQVALQSREVIAQLLSLVLPPKRRSSTKGSSRPRSTRPRVTSWFGTETGGVTTSTR